MKSQNTASITLASGEPLVGNSSGPARGVGLAAAVETSVPWVESESGAVAGIVVGSGVARGINTHDMAAQTSAMNTSIATAHLAEFFTSPSLT